MDAAQFDLPVRIHLADGEPVIEIYSAEEASDFLLGWHVQEGPIFESALSACIVAGADIASREAARRDFVAFARTCGILAKDVPLDSLYEGERLKYQHD